MDRGVTIKNPYASVTIPRAQLKDGFLKYYLDEDQVPDTALYNPSRLPTYTATQEKAWPETTEKQPQTAYNAKVPTGESWARPFNPYASLRMPDGASPEPFHWKSNQGAPPDGRAGGQGGGCCCCCPCCRRCSPCGRRRCCVVS